MILIFSTSKFYVFDNISDINATFSFNDNNCNYTIFKSEYLICCGNKDKIICERRDMNLSLISIFNLEHYKNIKNLTLKNNNDTYIELRYYDERLEDKNISEYRIYPPKCINKNISLIGNKSSVIDLDSLFVRKTNSNYYLHFNHIDDMKLNISINDEYMKTLNETHKLKYNDKKLHIEIKNIEENKKMILNILYPLKKNIQIYALYLLILLHVIILVEIVY